ncbi:FbpB family small basic protein [Cytobacillus firmus]|nr:FbpB family small basic protein [Cytobacillus firmus]MDD9314083.1 FbpB family small basic protein [Cytobacillus firmus]MED1905533.1 FbpB family small basic protein [Cytobacillus firmus]MED1942487.1 FbpB family small basic protein [Cytobacillus firmus]
MKKKKLSMLEMIKVNREELLKDRSELEKIEKKIDDKYAKAQ